MKLIITCDRENMAAAQELANREVEDNLRWQQKHGEAKYDKPGWGWFFYQNNVRFFVRGIKDGISVTQENALGKSVTGA